MLDALARATDHGGKLLGVSRTLFRNDPRFVTTVSFRFKSLTLGFRADPDLDELEATVGELTTDDDEVAAEVSASAPWSACVGRGLRWAWGLTNQQGYTDGVRLEFGDPDSGDEVVIELLVLASAIRVYKVEEHIP